MARRTGAAGAPARRREASSSAAGRQSPRRAMRIATLSQLSVLYGPTPAIIGCHQAAWGIPLPPYGAIKYVLKGRKADGISYIYLY